MSKIKAAIAYFEDAIRESDEIIADCSPGLQAELKACERLKKNKTDELDENYKDLYAAIYKQAVADDIREVRRQIHKVLSSRKISDSEIHRYLDRKEKEIEVQVQQDVCEEALNYGPETKRIQIKHIDCLVARLVDEYMRG